MIRVPCELVPLFCPHCSAQIFTRNEIKSPNFHIDDIVLNYQLIVKKMAYCLKFKN